MSERILRMARDADEFVTLEDGFVYYWPKKGGAIASHDLRSLADELDRLNAPWEAKIEEYFSTQPLPPQGDE